MISVGVGSSTEVDTTAAAESVCRQALEQMGTGQCDLALVFATNKHDAQVVRQILARQLGDCCLVGGSSLGTITNENLSYQGYELALLTLRSEGLEARAIAQGELNVCEFEAGQGLGRKYLDAGFTDADNLLLLYDSIKSSPAQGQLRLNMATPLLRGLGKTLKALPTMAGMGCVGDTNFNPTVQWHNNACLSQSAVGLAFRGLRMETTVMHGCRPASGYHEITGVQDNAVLTIDHQPALDFALATSGTSVEKIPMYYTLGINHSEDPFGEFREADYANRLVMAVDPERKALVMFEPDLKVGDSVQVMQRSIDFDYMNQACDAVLASLDGSERFALYIDCLGRASMLCGSDGEEAESVRQRIGAKMPLIGAYSGVEIAQVGKTTQALDWTGVLCIFREV